jgi:hypothetical protein
MNAQQALAFIEKSGVVLLSANGAVPRLTEAIAGEPIKGSWWGHAKGHEIFDVLQIVAESESVLFCRLIGGKVTLVHKRLWPALVSAAARFPKERLARVRQEHTASGKHVNHEIAFPEWVPDQVRADAAALSESEALQALGAWALTI